MLASRTAPTNGGRQWGQPLAQNSPTEGVISLRHSAKVKVRSMGVRPLEGPVNQTDLHNEEKGGGGGGKGILGEMTRFSPTYLSPPTDTGNRHPLTSARD